MAFTFNRNDVELLNNSINNLGQSFANRRKEDSAETHQRADEAYRQRLLDQEIERQKSAQAHYGAEEQHFKNMEQGQQAAAMDKDDQETFKTLTQLNASGALGNRDQVNAWLKNHPKWGKVGMALQAPTQKPQPQLGQSSVAQALQVADSYAARADSEPDPAKKQSLLDSEKILRESAKQAAEPRPKVDPGSYDTETSVYPAVPDKAATGPVWHPFSANEPAQPAVPGTPERRVVRKIPHGAQLLGQPPNMGSRTNAPTMRFTRDAGGNLVPAQ